MDETQLAVDAAQIARAMAPGFWTSLGVRLRAGQDRKNLEADHAFIEGMLEAGRNNFRYRGLASEFELFEELQDDEVRRLFENTVNAMLKANSIVDWSKVDVNKFNPEFRRRWMFEASNVSDETLQDLWARLLTGELESPGSVSNDTMSIARDLTKERAEEFQTLCSAALCDLDGTPMTVVSCGNPGANSLRPYGLSYDVLMRLAHHRLIVNDMTSHTTLAVDQVMPIIAVRQREVSWVLRWNAVSKPVSESYRIRRILFTLAGKELFSVVEKVPMPDYSAAMLKTLQKDGWAVTPIYK